MFHTGISIKDKSGLPEDDGKEGRVAEFADLKRHHEEKKALEHVIKEWGKLMDKCQCRL